MQMVCACTPPECSSSMECPGSCTLHLVLHLEEVANERSKALAKLLL